MGQAIGDLRQRGEAARQILRRRRAHATIDRRWPHQVAVPGDVVRQRFAEVEKAKGELQAAPRGHSVFHGDTWYTVVCFADPARAEEFRLRFGGEPFNPADRGRGANWSRWNKPRRV
jgi:hypothetical protein